MGEAARTSSRREKQPSFHDFKLPVAHSSIESLRVQKSQAKSKRPNLFRKFSSAMPLITEILELSPEYLQNNRPNQLQAVGQ